MLDRKVNLLNDLPESILTYSCTFLSPKDLVSVGMCCKKCNEVTETAAGWSLGALSRKHLTSMYGGSVMRLEGSNKYKLHEITRQRLLTVGGSFNPTRVDHMNLESGKWEQSTDEQLEREASDSVVIRGEVYLISGEEKSSSVTKYSPLSRAWTPIISLPLNVKQVASCTDGESIIVTGGQNTDTNAECSNVFVHRVESEAWQPSTPLPNPRRGHACVYFQDKVWVAGGFSFGVSVASILSLSGDTWTTEASMVAPRHHFSLVVLKEKLYAVGGDEDCTIEEYDSDLQTWTTIATCPQHRRNFACTASSDRIFVLGGRSKRSRFYSSWIAYDVGRREWVALEDDTHNRQVPGEGGFAFGQAVVVPDKALTW